MSKDPTPKLDQLRALREQNYEEAQKRTQMFERSRATIRKALAEVNEAVKEIESRPPKPKGPKPKKPLRRKKRL